MKNTRATLIFTSLSFLYAACPSHPIPPGHLLPFHLFLVSYFQRCPVPRAHRYCGVFVSGARPAWLVASRGSLILHRASESSPVAAMTPFHNASCLHVSGIGRGLGVGCRLCSLTFSRCVRSRRAHAVSL